MMHPQQRTVAFGFFCGVLCTLTLTHLLQPAIITLSQQQPHVKHFPDVNRQHLGVPRPTTSCSVAALEQQMPNATAAVNRQIQYVLVLTKGSSGSTWLSRVLSNIDGFTFGGEKMMPFSLMKKHQKKNLTWHHYRSKLDHQFDLLRSNDNKKLEQEQQQLVGFKLMYEQVPSHLYYPHFANWLNEHQVHVIHLIRSSALQYVSHAQKVECLKATETSAHITNAQEMGKLARSDYVPSKVTAGGHWFERTVRERESLKTAMTKFLQVHAYNAPVFTVSYEDLHYPPHQSAWMNAILAFLGSSHRLETTLPTSAPNGGGGGGVVTTMKIAHPDLCEDRMNNVTAPNYSELAELSVHSQVTCAMLHQREAAQPISTNAFNYPREE